jgi:signal transduction histidine kinase
MTMSLRGRVWLGAVFWTMGLLALVSAALIHVMAVYPPAATMVHHFFAHPIVGVGAVICLILGAERVRRGLSGIQPLRARLAAVREGRERRIDGAYPSEVQPLVDDLNGLIEHRERAVARAVAKAGDLAHNLKTPLAVLAREADRAEAAGHHEIAASISQQVERMRRQVDYHLAHARAAASGAGSSARCGVRESAEGLSRALQRLHAERGLTIQIHAPDDHVVRTQREDLDEMLGNLLDNACTWARSRVVVTSEAAGGAITILVDDDGPGLPEEMRKQVLQRGVKADEGMPGSGLGLAIVGDLTEVYGGSLSLESAPPGGLRARLQLPA